MGALPASDAHLARPFSALSSSGIAGLGSDDALDLMRDCWAATFGHPVRPDESFFALGGDTALAVDLLSRVAESFGETVPLAVLREAQTPRLLTTRLRFHPRPIGPGLVELMPGPDPTVFFFAAGGGDVSIYGALAASLGHRAVVVVPPGSDDASRPLRTIEAIVRLGMQRIREVQPHGPYILGGFSSGAAVAYEAAALFALDDEEVSLAVLLDPVRPVHGISRLDEAFRLFRRRQFRKARQRMLLPVAEWRNDLNVWRAERRGRTPSLRQLYLRMEASTRRALAGYRPRQYTGPHVLLRAADDRQRSSRERCWPELVRGRCAEINAAHLGSRGLMVPPQVDDVAAALFPTLRALSHT